MCRHPALASSPATLPLVAARERPTLCVPRARLQPETLSAFYLDELRALEEAFEADAADAAAAAHSRPAAAASKKGSTEMV